MSTALIVGTRTKTAAQSLRR